MTYRSDMSRLTFFWSVNFPGESPENGEDAGKLEHRQVAVVKHLRALPLRSIGSCDPPKK